jgi:hypothetical protein
MPVERQMPDVLVLVLSGMGSVDRVSITYSSVVSEDAVKADIKALAKESAWLVGQERVTAKTVGEGRKTTSGSFNTLSTINYKEGLLPIAPFINTLKRFRSIQLVYLVPQQFQFRGLKDFENEFVNLQLEQHGNSYQYRISIKDNRFERLVLPAHQPKPQPKEKRGLSSGSRVVLIISIALGCALIAYFGARAIYRRGSAG